MTQGDAIDAFWAWWPTARPRIEAAIAGDGFDDALVEDIAAHVRAIDEDLDWELSPGATSRHAFCLSGKADPEKRLLTEVWRVRGPQPDETWEYHPARKGGPVRAGMTLEIGGHTVDLSEFVAAWEVDENRERVDAMYYHPAFADIEDENLRGTITFLMLDGAFGEDGVERWLGSIEPADEEPEGARPIAELQDAVAEMSRLATGEKFAVLRGEDDGGHPIFVTINQALKRIDHLLCIVHAAIDMAILEPDDHGMPSNDEAEQLNAIEDELAAQLAGAGAYFGRETRRGRRILHWFTPEDGARGKVEAWAERHAGRDIQATWTRDPAWEAQHRFT
ncbi:MAG: DUF695 domain-containing protein [Deltaproteobacteria bacterium]|nr:DUF695 domain-containing protein [Deltaproteobacteria bacterium]MCW5801265.1 DUF695 domain-containing protein [Deltaproteobacteria bacterium]